MEMSRGFVMGQRGDRDLQKQTGQSTWQGDRNEPPLPELQPLLPQDLHPGMWGM